ncbi:tyrosine-protein phosphatase [Pseudooceanicola batsensis]|nr:tyrosine-protein phosphatase [Pseudooceanicola batsensis]
MAERLWPRIQHWYSMRNQRISRRLLDLTDRPAVERFVRWNDHGIFRELWTNLHEVAPGVWRSNHPNERRFTRYRDMGIRTILNLRGAEDNVTYRWEERLCAEHGIRLHAVRLDARRAPQVEPIQQVLAVLRQAERPLLFHCKSGADRAGLVSALYLLVIEGQPADIARKMLSRRFLHFRSSMTGVLDHFLESYARAHSRSGIGFEEWLVTEYDPAALQAEFDATRR